MIASLGGVGMPALISAISLGKGKVAGVEANPEKPAQATELDADEVYSPSKLEETGINATIAIEAAGLSSIQGRAMK